MDQWKPATRSSTPPLLHSSILPLRAAALAALRALAVAAVAAALLNPVLTREQQESGRPPLLVLLDTSHSMAVADIGGRTRFSVAKQALLEDSALLRDYQQRFTPVYFTVAEGAVRQE